MDNPGTSPFAILTFLAAPAILTNASSVLTLSTSNRFARAIDRARTLAGLLKEQSQNARQEPWLADDARLQIKQLRFAERRVLLLVRAMTAFYWAVGSFALGALTSLLGASLSVGGYGGTHATTVVAFLAGVSGVGGLVTGSTLLVWETHVTHRLLREETAAMHHFARGRLKEWEARVNAPESGGTQSL